MTKLKKKHTQLINHDPVKRMNYLTKKKIPNVLVTISFVNIFIFLNGLLDRKGFILNSIYICFGNFVTLF